VGVQNRKESKEKRLKREKKQKVPSQKRKEKKETPLAISCRKRVSSMNI
jgi:hypothetical protein